MIPEITQLLDNQYEVIEFRRQVCKTVANQLLVLMPERSTEDRLLPALDAFAFAYGCSWRLSAAGCCWLLAACGCWPLAACCLLLLLHKAPLGGPHARAF